MQPDGGGESVPLNFSWNASHAKALGSEIDI
jgi:hypothetical protein